MASKRESSRKYGETISLEMAPDALENPNVFSVFTFGDKKNAKVIDNLDAIIDFAVEMGRPVPARYLEARRSAAAPPVSTMAKSLRIGFTGTQSGMSHGQLGAAYKWLGHTAGAVDILHHGSCQGADAEADGMARWLGIKVEIHPGHPKGKPNDKTKQAPCAQPGDVVHASKFFLDRNHDIVNATDVLLVTPFGFKEIIGRGSGTWATWRFAKKLKASKRPEYRIVMVWPDGKVEED